MFKIDSIGRHKYAFIKYAVIPIWDVLEQLGLEKFLKYLETGGISFGKFDCVAMVRK